jgi:hypothetical protein
MPWLVPGIHDLRASAKSDVDGRDHHRRAKRRRSSNGYGERSDAVLRTAMASEATPFFERLCPAMTESVIQSETILL